MVSSAELIRSIGWLANTQAVLQLGDACCFSVFLPNHYRAPKSRWDISPHSSIWRWRNKGTSQEKKKKIQGRNKPMILRSTWVLYSQPPAARSLWSIIPGRPGFLLLLRLRGAEHLGSHHRGDQVPALKTGLGTLEVWKLCQINWVHQIFSRRVWTQNPQREARFSTRAAEIEEAGAASLRTVKVRN